jgi:acetyltransferase-like isoleucine patch superfamily enzyme
MPWVINFEIRRVCSIPIYRLFFALHGIPWGKHWRVWGMPIIQRYRGSQISLGDGLLLRSWHICNPLAPNHAVVLATRSTEAVIKVGQNVGMTGTTLVATERVEIGPGVQIGANAVIVDTDFHPVEPWLRRTHGPSGRHAAVLIEREVFIGMNCLILKGVRIGSGSVIGAGSVVTRDIPPGVIAAGNPARVVRPI